MSIRAAIIRAMRETGTKSVKTSRATLDDARSFNPRRAYRETIASARGGRAGVIPAVAGGLATAGAGIYAAEHMKKSRKK